MSRKFSDLELLPGTLKVLHEELGFKMMTPVQSATLPLFLGNKDVVVEACTGSGKTIAYLVPVVERLQRVSREWAPYNVGAVILVPTRELATQIFGVSRQFCLGTPLTPYLATGGSGDVGAELVACSESGANVVIATPGRLLDFLRRGEGVSKSGVGSALSFKTLEILVLDEADTLLELGFSETLTAILSMLPKQRRTGLFSATQTQEVKALARAGLRNPVVVTVKVQRGEGGRNPIASPAAAAAGGPAAAAAPPTQSTPHTLKNFYTVCTDPMDKLMALGGSLREAERKGDKVIVFFLTCASVDIYGKLLNAPGVRAALGIPLAFPVLPLHGQMVPKKRTGMFSNFTASQAAALLCTDVAARGIDLPDVTSIIQFDPPTDPNFFIHRVGRTARAGRFGSSSLFLLPPETGYLHFMGAKGVPIAERMRESYNNNNKRGEKLFVAGAANNSMVVAKGQGGGGGGGGGESEGFPPPTTLPPQLPLSPRQTLLAVMQQECIADRDVLEKASRAYVSFIRGYKEHSCRTIFRLEALDACSLGESFGLLKLPKVEELRGQKLTGYVGARPDINTRNVAYADPKREAGRQERLRVHGDEIAASVAARDKRREKALTEAAHAAAAAPAGAAPAEPKRKREHKGLNSKIMEEWELMGREERLEKRLKRGKCSKAEYKKELRGIHRDMGISAEDEDSLDDED